MKQWRHSLVVAVIVAVTAMLGWSLRFDTAALPPFWPSTGFLFALLVTHTRTEWPRIMLAAAIAQLLVDQWMAPGASPFQAFFVSLLVLVNAFLGAHIVLLFMNKPRRRSAAAEIMAYSVVAALVAPGVCALLATAVLAPWLGAGDVLGTLLIWWSGSFLGITLAAPLLVTMAMLRGEDAAPGRAARVETLLACAALFGVAVLCLGPYAARITGALDAPPPFAAFAVLPPLLWAGMRCDPRVVAGACLVLFIIASAYAGDGFGPFASNGQRWQSVYSHMQLYFFTVCGATLILAWAMYERRNVVNLLRTRVGIGDLVVAMFNRFASTPFDRIDEVVGVSLRDVGEFAAADRVWLMRFDRKENRLVVPNHWSRPGIEAHADQLDGLPLSQVRWAVDRLSNGEQLLLLRRDPPPGAEDVIRVMAAARTLVAGFVPLVEDGEVIGAMGFDWVRTERYWSDDIVALLYIVGQLFVGALRRERNEREVSQYQQRLRGLAAELALTEERARREAAVDLHDGIGQNLAVARIKLSLLEKELGSDHQTLCMLHDLMDVALQQTRHVVSGLSPSVLYEIGLAPALRSLANAMSERWDLPISFREEGSARQVSEESRLTLYRVVRELLTNIVKHAHASRASIVLEWRKDAIVLAVSDNGRGFSPSGNESEDSDGSGFGLFSIRERMLSQGGSVNIDSSVGGGTQVRLLLPLGLDSATERHHDYDVADS